MQLAPRKESIRVVIADDHDLIRMGIKALLSLPDDIEVVAEAGNGRELITLVERVMPDVVITDISMPDMDGFAAILHIHSRYPDVLILVVSMHDTADFVKRAVSNGASGYMCKGGPLEIERAVRTVVATGRFFSPAIANLLQQPSEPTIEEELTERQIEILKLIAQGRSAREIGAELGLSSKTVDVHRSRIMHRLGLNDIASLTVYAMRKGLIHAGG